MPDDSTTSCARGLDVRTLRGDAREHARDMLDAAPILAEPAGDGAVIAWGLVVVLGIGILALASGRDWGVVTRWDSIGLLGWTSYAIGGALVARGAIGLRGALRRPPAPWPRGRFAFPCGFVDARGPVLRVLPIEHLDSVTVSTSDGNQLALQTIDLRFTDGSIERFTYAVNRGSPPRPRLGELEAARDAVRAGGDRRAYELVAAGTPPPRARWSRRRTWITAAVAGLALQAGAYLWLLPSKSVAAAVERNNPENWTAVAKAFPFGWVRDRGTAATETIYDNARARIRERIHAPVARDALIAAVDDLALHHTTTIGVVASLEDPAELSVATAWLAKQVASTDATASTVVVSSYGAETIVRRFDPLFEGTTVSVSTTAAEGDPVILVRVHVHADKLFRADSNRVYAGLALDVDAIVVAAGKRYPLASPVTVPPPKELSVSRLAFRGDAPRAVDAVDDILVYTQMFGSQLEIAGGELIRHLGD